MRAIRIIFTIVCASVFSVAGFGEAERPNIIIFMFDDLGYSDLGSYGSEIRTPHIDSLAANGLRFRSFYNTSRCSPTRMSLMTGAWTHRVADDPGASGPRMRPDNNVTIAEILRDIGYGTYLIGKWHIGATEQQAPAARGFEFVLGHGFRGAQVGQASYYNPHHLTLITPDDVIEERVYSDLPGDYYQKDAFRDYASDFLDHHFTHRAESPFFMYVPFNVPHFYIDAPKEFIETAPEGGKSYLEIYESGWDVIRAERHQRMIDLGVIDANAMYTDSWVPYPRSNHPDEVPQWDTLSDARKADATRRMALYAAMVEQGDRVIGTVVEKLRNAGQLDNTLIMILSDNGGAAEGGVFGRTRVGDMENPRANHPPLTGEDLENMGQPGSFNMMSIGGGWAEVSNTPFRYYKRHSHEGGIRTPMVFHWPLGIEEPDRWTDQDGHVVDVVPTVIDIVGVVHPSAEAGTKEIVGLDGASLLPALRGGEVWSRTLGFEHEGTRGWIEGDWKLVTKTFSDPLGDANEIELYHRRHDPTELENLAGRYPGRVRQMIHGWRKWATDVGVLEERMIEVPHSAPPETSDELLFFDSFNRGTNTEIDQFTVGMGGTLLPDIESSGVWLQSYGEEQTRIFGQRLQMADGGDISEVAWKYNFVDPANLRDGAFSVGLEISEIICHAADQQDRYVGFGVGLSGEDILLGGDIDSGRSFRGSRDSGGGRADFFVELDGQGDLNIWIHGEFAAGVPFSREHGVIMVDFVTESFDAGQEVLAEVYFEGRIVDLQPGDPARNSITFTWRETDANHIGFSARTTGFADVDNFTVFRGRVARDMASGFAGLPAERDATGGWKSVEGLGMIHADAFPWIYHKEHSWLYSNPDTWKNFAWFYEARIGKWWASRMEIYPWVYTNDEGWSSREPARIN